jgi:hypothetical protein
MTQPGYGFEIGKYHPLFLPEDGSTEADFAPPTGSKELKWIQVSRIERGEEVKLVPGKLDPTELQNEEDIFARWGAGTYVLTARTVGGFVYSKRKLVLRDPNASPAPAGAGPAQASPHAIPSGLSGNDGMMLALLQMMNANQQADRERESRAAAERERSQREFMTMQMAQQQQNTQMLVAVLGNAGNTQNEMMRQTMALMSNARQGGAGATDSIKALQGVYDLAKTMAPKAPSGDGFDWSQIAQLVGGFLGGMAEASKNGQGGGQNGAPAVVTVQAEPVPAPPAMGPSPEPQPAG